MDDRRAGGRSLTAVSIRAAGTRETSAAARLPMIAARKGDQPFAASSSPNTGRKKLRS
ncbi:hypothetical protein [Lysobacter gummosus]|uniref:hypothetical protein n=1 Tax=Lysobacter gummosus TaxID=262324 RepID=UPI00362E0E36